MGFLKEKVTLNRAVPRYAVPGGRVTIMGAGFDGRMGNASELLLNGVAAHVTTVSSKMLTVTVPGGISESPVTVSLGGELLGTMDLHVANLLATDVHPVDNPVVDSHGSIYTTLSGTRGQEAPVSIFRITPAGVKESFVTDIMNPTSLAIGPDDALYVSSRFTGAVYRVTRQADVSVYAEGLGTATGIVFDREGNLIVGDRSGTIYVIKPDRAVIPLLSIPSSVAAFHLCLGPDGALYVTNPDISTYDCILRIAPGASEPTIFYPGIKRPQGMAFDVDGNLYVAKAMAGDSGILRIAPDGKAAMIASGPVLVGLAFDAAGNMVIAGTDSIYRLSAGIKPLPRALTSFFPPPKINP